MSSQHIFALISKSDKFYLIVVYESIDQKDEVFSHEMKSSNAKTLEFPCFEFQMPQRLKVEKNIMTQ
jgi:hypothetical protein